MKKIDLYFPYYTPASPERHDEIKLCLKKNQENIFISSIYLLIDDGSEPPSFVNDKITVIQIASRLTYKVWLLHSEQRSQGAISLLSNSDIYFDETLGRLSAPLTSGGLYSFVTLSRYELINRSSKLHPNPKWSQDAWALLVRGEINSKLINASDFALGVPRCDNKIAAVFYEHGFQVHNPCKFIRSYHVHKSNIRSYDASRDTTILGGTLWVNPSETLTTPSSVHVDYWALNSTPNTTFKINDSFSQILRCNTLSVNLVEQSLIIAHDSDWQYPAITEKHAFSCLLKAFSHDKFSIDIKYLAFPWATLIDMLKTNPSSPKCIHLLDSLKHLSANLQQGARVITVCQHIRMLEFQNLFANSGVTDVYWSHAVVNQEVFPDHPSISIYPFPLFPAQASEPKIKSIAKKDYLFSFVGAKAAPFYLTDVRNIIIDGLAGIPDAYVKGRDSWHYNKIVYDHQIKDSQVFSEDLVNNEHTEDFINILERSLFSLCPSGSGPNSIRLWESIGLGAIPVILADSLRLPGDLRIWHEACVFCEENERDILQLPAKLSQLAKDKDLISRKQSLLHQIWFLYGPDNFVTDVKSQILLLLNKDIRKQKPFDPNSRSEIPGKDTFSSHLGRIATTADSYKLSPPTLASLNTLILSSPEEGRNFIRSNYAYVTKLYNESNREAQKIFIRLNSLKKLETSFWKK
jgi:hypothetical protein